MNQFLVILITALLSGAVSVAGIWITNYLTRTSETEKWRRDHALEAYTELVKAVEGVLFEADRIYLMECGTEEHVKQAGIVLDKTDEMYRLSGRVFLLAPNEVNAHMDTLTLHAGTKIAALSRKCPKSSESEQKAAREKLTEYLVAFRVAARNDLGIYPPLYKTAKFP
jgi:hypothetical protein